MRGPRAPVGTETYIAGLRDAVRADIIRKCGEPDLVTGKMGSDPDSA